MYNSTLYAIGQRVAVTIRKINVNAASTSDRAISLGVRCRMAPSTRAIMRSRNELPGLAVISTTIRSDSTRVPPVTPERSPPASRMTGADSPVMADSSMEAIPSMISPSPGITSPATISTRSPARSSVETVCSIVPSVLEAASRGGSPRLCATHRPGPCRGLRRWRRRSWRRARSPRAKNPGPEGNRRLRRFGSRKASQPYR